MRIWHMFFNAPLYFDNVYEDEWIEDGFVKDMIQDVDHCTVAPPRLITIRDTTITMTQ